MKTTLDDADDGGQSEYSERAFGFALFTVILQFGGDLVPGFLEETVAQFLAFLPRLIGALIILIIGWIIGRVVAGIVKRLADSADLDNHVRGTPLGRMFGAQHSDNAVAAALGKLVKWFIYALAILTAADALAIPLLSRWIARALAYLPAFVAGILIIVFGFIVADFIGDMIQRTQGTTGTSYTSWFATGVRMFLYFVVITIGLDTMGVDTEILYIFATALAWGLAAAIALGLGLGLAIALGWGGHGYVSENIDQWTSRARQRAPRPSNGDQSSDRDQSNP